MFPASGAFLLLPKSEFPTLDDMKRSVVLGLGVVVVAVSAWFAYDSEYVIAGVILGGYGVVYLISKPDKHPTDEDDEEGNVWCR